MPQQHGALTPAPDLVVAIDGPSGSGKSTVARRVAAALGLRYLDTGAMYRALTWLVLRDGTDPADADAVVATAERADLVMGTDPDAPGVHIAGTDVAQAIRTAEVTAAVSTVSAHPGVRAELLRRQRDAIGGGGIVVEGRDIGTTVAPDAPVKIFLTASADARADRRARELAGAAVDGSAVQRTEADLRRRDELDSTRAASPLVQAPDAVTIDSTALPIDDVVAAVLDRVAQLGAPPVVER